MLFRTQYRKWLDQCLQQHNQRFPSEVRKWHQETCPQDYDPGDLVEIGENGTVYPHGIGGTNYIPDVVTPWEQSEHFVS